MNRINEVIEELRATFQKKQEQYKGATTDIFRNFNQGAALQSESPQQTLLGYVNKHMVNLFDAKKHNPERLQDEKYINEVAGDIAVYMIILMAMVRGEKEEVRGDELIFEREFMSSKELNARFNPYPYVFPATKFVDNNFIKDQVFHIASEGNEIVNALRDEGFERLTEEVLDCIHSCETLLRKLEDEPLALNINYFRNKVVEKNKNRGYYKK